MRADLTGFRPWLLAGCAMLAGSGAVARAAAQDPAVSAAAAAKEADSASQATPLFEVSPAPVCKAPAVMCYWSRSDAPVTLIYTKTHMVILDPDFVDTTRGIAHITADRADETGTDPANSQWVFSGNVHFDSADGQLRANTATVQIVDQRVATIVAQGSPVLFQRLPYNPLAPAAGSAAAAAAPAAGTAATSKSKLAGLAIHGHAQSIIYDATHDRVQFMGDSWFTDGCNEITGELVTYNMATQTVQAGASPGGHARVHGTVRNTHPGSGSSCTTGAPGSASTPPRGAPASSAPAPVRAPGTAAP